MVSAFCKEIFSNSGCWWCKNDVDCPTAVAFNLYDAVSDEDRFHPTPPSVIIIRFSVCAHLVQIWSKRIQGGRIGFAIDCFQTFNYLKVFFIFIFLVFFFSLQGLSYPMKKTWISHIFLVLEGNWGVGGGSGEMRLCSIQWFCTFVKTLSGSIR